MSDHFFKEPHTIAFENSLFLCGVDLDPRPPSPFYYQMNDTHAVLVSEMLSWESPKWPSIWNFLVYICEVRDSERWRAALVSSFVKGRLCPHLHFQLPSKVGKAPTIPKKVWVQNKAFEHLKSNNRGLDDRWGENYLLLIGLPLQGTWSKVTAIGTERHSPRSGNDEI